MFCFDKLHFLLAVGDILEQILFGIPDMESLVDNVASPISHDFEISLNSIYKSTQVNNVSTIGL